MKTPPFLHILLMCEISPPNYLSIFMVLDHNTYLIDTFVRSCFSGQLFEIHKKFPIKGLLFQTDSINLAIFQI